MQPRRWGIGLAAGVSALALALAPAMVPQVAPTAQAQNAPAKKVLRIGVTQEVDSLNPYIAIYLLSTNILRTNYDYLTVFGQKNMAPEGALAESWETSPDKLTWTFHMRHGVKWSDGQELTAKDPAFTFNTMLTNETARTANGSYVANFESVTATDPYTLVIKTKKPQATMLGLDVPIVPEHVYSKMKDIGGEPPMPLVGSGPFTVTEFKADQFVKMVANKSYWRGAPKVDEVDFIYYKNSDASVQALRNGEVDLVNKLSATQFDVLKNEPNVTLNNAKDRRFNELVINPGATTSSGEAIGNGNPALKDVALRRAIAQAIDTKTLTQKVYGEYALPGDGSYVPPVFSDFHWTPAPAQSHQFNPTAANAALDAAGYKRGSDGIRLDHSGKPLNLRLLTHSEKPQEQQGAPYIRGWLHDIGINVTIQPLSDNKINEATTAGQFDLTYSGWSSSPDPDNILSLQTCSARPNAQGKGGTPDTFMCDKAYDDLYAQQLAEFDRAKRIDIVKQMQSRLYDNAVNVMLYYDDSLEAYRKDKFASFATQPDPGGTITYQQGYWGYYGAVPAGEGGASNASSQDSGSNTGLILGVIGGVVVIAAVAGVVVARRRKSTADERE
ncbi:peptide/nickel transport system substrate-binding protein [Labedaea rhizosphaerae]|uniref:Peptide/nickel transport system substrate-binding protein n=1 Tax=Labedaea rhizosphaerae TaxID=598644 RepID=A0A4R6RWI6_LABRH|nr:peptide/nickel transport system substrate-binding protein [Labedaea rhizosphaerae]